MVKDGDHHYVMLTGKVSINLFGFNTDDNFTDLYKT